jgi:hypothetical protein
MVNILDEFYFDPKKKDKYTLGRVTSVTSSNIYSIKIFVGAMTIKIKDKFNTYNIGDRVIVSDFGSLNGAFIVKKVSFLFPTVTNTVIGDGQG